MILSWFGPFFFLPLFLFFTFSWWAWYFFHFHVPFLYPGCIFLLLGHQFLFIFRKYFYTINLHNEVNLFLQFYELVAPCILSGNIAIMNCKGESGSPGASLDFLPTQGFVLPLSIPPSSFPWWSLWFCRIFCAFSDILLLKFAVPCHGLSWQFTPWLHLTVSFWAFCECASLFIVDHLFSLSSCSLLSE